MTSPDNAWIEANHGWYLARWRQERAGRVEAWNAQFGPGRGEAIVRRQEDFLAKADPDRYGWMLRYRPSVPSAAPAQRRPVALPPAVPENYNAPFSKPGRRP
jgi:hypothetical protein